MGGEAGRRNPAVPASTGDEALLQCAKPSGVPRGPSHLQFPWLLRATMRSPLRSPAQVEGTQGFPSWFRGNSLKERNYKKQSKGNIQIVKTPKLIKLGTRFPWSFVQGKPGEGDWLDL